MIYSHQQILDEGGRDTISFTSILTREIRSFLSIEAQPKAKPIEEALNCLEATCVDRQR